jgi:hypothetical protein
MSSSDSLQRLRKLLYRSNAIDVLCVLVLIAYFLHFAVPSLAGGFNDDEMMNIYVYWRLGALKSLWANICFWKGIGRPAGALYYLPLYHFFVLDPQPYRIVQVSILAASIPMVYYLARLPAACRSVAFLAVLTLCYHAQLANLVFVGSFIYDVLCGFFYFAALTYYIYVREREIALGRTQLLGFLALYICALNSKEMAVTLPLIVLIYEVLKCPRFGEWKQFARRNWRFAVPGLIAGLLTVPYIYGKLQGGSALAKLTAYRPRYSWHRFVTSNAHFIDELFYLSDSKRYYTAGVMLLAGWAAVFLYAFLRRDRMLQLMAFWIVITPLPLAFIPLRGGACLYILLFGWAMIFAKLASDLIKLISNSLTLLREHLGVEATSGATIEFAAINRGRGGAIGAIIGVAAGKMCVPIFRISAPILIAFALAIFTQWENQRFGRVHAFFNSGQKSLHVIRAFRSLDLHPLPGSMIFLRPENRFYQNGYYPAFVAALVWNDHSLRIYVEGQHQLSQRQIANMNYVISFNEFQAKLLPAPEPDHS